MVDQLTGTLFPDGPAISCMCRTCGAGRALGPVCQQLYRLAALRAGAAVFMSGQLPRRTRVYDNAAEFTSDIPTFAHHLRRAGYQTALSGKMHFVGPDQLHGFEQRLTTDIYPADFGWTPDYRKPGERIDWWYHNMGSVTGAPAWPRSPTSWNMTTTSPSRRCRRSMTCRAGRIPGPGACASFTHPHDPFVARRKYWDLYEGAPNWSRPRPCPTRHRTRTRNG
jgi:choline-sulfatase